MSRPTDDEIVLWIGNAIVLAQHCEEARLVCAEQHDVIDAGAIRALEVVGELINLLYKAPIGLGPMLPDIPWKSYIGMRIILAHKPWEVDREIVWDTISRDLPLPQEALPDLSAALRDFAAN